MKNLKKYFVIALVMCVMLIALSMTSVKAAAGSLLLQTGPTGTTTPTPSPTATPTPSPSATVRITTTPTPTPVPTSGTDLPKTGENDIYIVSSIGLVVLAIGGVAYIKSRKYSM